MRCLTAGSHLGELKFDPLHKSNLFEADFFDLLYDTRQSKQTFLTDGFDIVIGNPPFESALTDVGEKLSNLPKSRISDVAHCQTNKQPICF